MLCTINSHDKNYSLSSSKYFKYFTNVCFLIIFNVIYNILTCKYFNVSKLKFYASICKVNFVYYGGKIVNFRITEGHKNDIASFEKVLCDSNNILIN